MRFMAAVIGTGWLFSFPFLSHSFYSPKTQKHKKNHDLPTSVLPSVHNGLLIILSFEWKKNPSGLDSRSYPPRC
ncbi:hypothetical protein QBC35DRAFT_485453 [Podospora australis]|uniref:Secreted protein n=1 Tax=Podospora australis TaxID=1536484 RepID=A0AAN6X2B3_9PEZI|nr:hypothetical protein QBC35DRAFT_485453 [Podospora australis]